MKKMTRFALTLLACLGVFTLASCSKEDDGAKTKTEQTNSTTKKTEKEETTETSTNDEMAETGEDLATVLAASFVEGQLVEDATQGECVANGFIDGVGEERLAEVGITADGDNADTSAFTDEEWGTFLNSFTDCGIDTAALTLEVLGFNPNLDEPAADCINEEFADIELQTALWAAAGSRDTATLTALVEDIAGTCDVALEALRSTDTTGQVTTETDAMGEDTTTSTSAG